MRRALSIVAGIILAILIVVVLAVLTLTNTDWGRERVRRLAVSAGGGTVHGKLRIGQLDGNLLHEVIVHDVTITDSAGAPFLSVQAARVQYALASFLKKRIVLRSLALERPVIVLDHPPNGTWNFARLFPSKPGPKDTVPGWGSWVVLENVRITDGDVRVRTPWIPNVNLSAAARDSAIRVALAGQTRQRVEKVPGGYQQIMRFEDINAALPRLRLAMPDSDTRLFEVGALTMLAEPFREPYADVRALRGTVFMSTDSLWFRDLNAAFPATRLSMSGSYVLGPGDATLSMRAAPISLADLRVGYPRLPSDAHGSLDFTMAYRKTGWSDFVVKNAALDIGRGSLAGDLGIAMGATPDSLRVHDTDLRFARIDTRLLEQVVPRLTLPRRGTLGGRAALAGTVRAMHVDADVAFDDARDGTSRVLATGTVGTVAAGGFRADDLRLRLAPLQVDLARVVRPTLPIGGTLTGTAVVNGSTADRIAARADMVHQERGARSHVVGEGVATMRGRRWVNAELRLLPLSLTEAGRFAPALALQGSASGRVHVEGELSALGLVADLRLPDGGTLATRGRFDVASAVKSYDVRTGLQLFNLRSVSARGPATSLTATTSLTGYGTDPKTMHATLAADLERSEIDSVHVDSARVRLAVAQGLLRVDTASIRTPFARVLAQGDFGLAPGTSGRLGYRVEVDSLSGVRRWLAGPDTGAVPPRPGRQAELIAQARADSARHAAATEVARAATGAPGPALHVDTIRAVRRDSIAGSLVTAGELSGGVQQFALRGRVAASNIVARGNTVRGASLEYAVSRRAGGAPAMVVGGSFDSVQTGGFAFDSLQLRGTYTKPSGSVDVIAIVDTTHEYRLAGDFTLRPDANELRLHRLGLRFDTTLWAAVRPSAIRWGTRGIAVDSLDLRHGPMGRIFVNGLLPTKGVANMQLDIAGLEIGNLVQLLQSDITATGTLALQARVAGSRAAPTLRGALAVSNASYRGTSVPDIRSTFRYANTAFGAHTDFVRGDGAPVATLDAQLPVNLALGGVTGRRLLDRPMRVDLRADSLPLDVLPRFTDAVSDVHGRVIGAVAIRGTPQAPRTAGQLQMDFATFRVVPQGVTFREIGGLVHLMGDTLVVDSLLGYAGNGAVMLTGGLGLKTLTTPSIDLHLVARDAMVLDNEHGRLFANADLRAGGPFTRVMITGAARINNGVIYVPASSGQKVINTGDPAVFSIVDTALAENKQLLPAQSPLLKNLRLDVSLDVQHDTWVRSVDYNVEIYSDADEPLHIRLNQATGRTTVEGVVHTDRGEYTFFGRRFTLSRGTATFIGDPELNPLVQVTAEHPVELAGRGSINISIIIGGTVSHPNVQLTSDAQPPISQTDLLSYLAFGRSSSSLLQLESSGLSGQGTNSGTLVGNAAALATRQLTAIAVGVMTKQAEANATRELGADEFTIMPADIPTELSFSGVSSLLAGTQVEAGKYVSRQTFVAVQARPVLVVPGVRLEHRMNKGYRIEVSYEPRFLLREPSLSANQPLTSTNVLGAFLIREWRF